MIALPSIVLIYSQQFHILNTTTTLDVWTRRVWILIRLRIMVVEAMIALWEGWLQRGCFENVQETY